MMSFAEKEEHEIITDTIKDTLTKHDITGIRADDKEHKDELLNNIKIYMHCCDFGIAVFEKIQSDYFNPNVVFEVGYMYGLQKKICLLKGKSLKSLHTDLIPKLYKEFDTSKIETDINQGLTQWLNDYSKKIYPE